MPDLVTTADKMTAQYSKLAKATHNEVFEFLAGKAEERRDFFQMIARNHDVPPLDPTLSIVPAASFGPLESNISTLFDFERTPSKTEAVEGWTEAGVGSVDLIVPRSVSPTISNVDGGTKSEPASEC